MSVSNRKTWMIDRQSVEGWELKLYAILLSERVISDPEIQRVLQFVQQAVHFPQHSGSEKCGFLTIHFGEDYVWLLVDLWMSEIVRHYLFMSDLDSPFNFRPGPADGTMACIWELAVTCHERRAWIHHVLSPAVPDVQGYLEDALTINF